MDKFERHTGVAAAMLRGNVDTDAIIPSREMKRVSKDGLGEGLFAGWRYLEQGGREPNPDFVLNQPAYEETSILFSGPNFGCGSSREHAVWALAEFGIRAIIAPGFGAIFANNCVRNGLLPLVLEDVLVSEIAAWTRYLPTQVSSGGPPAVPCASLPAASTLGAVSGSSVPPIAISRAARARKPAPIWPVRPLWPPPRCAVRSPIPGSCCRDPLR